jgi:hypothetical protein
MATADELRKLAAWYRERAERAGNPTIWDARLRTAEDLEAEAERIEQRRCSERPGSNSNDSEPVAKF